ncbi:MAG: iron uptake porin, partial [Spirulinaceae cyanobacterium]
MSKLLWQVCKVAPAVLGASLLVTNSSFAAETSAIEAVTSEASTSQEVADASLSTDEMLQQINDYNGDETSLDQVTSVNQLSDIDPFWFSAVQKMVDKYGCIVGYPDGTFKGQRNITRYEFAAAVSRCMEWVEENIGSVDGEDLVTLRRLVQEFEAELAVLGARVDDLEGRVAFVEDNQFSTTTKLKGEVIFNVAGAFGDEFKAVDAGDAQGSDGDLEDNITFGDRVRLTLDTSFTGRDRLRTRLQAGNIDSFENRTGTEMSRLGYEAGGGNNVGINRLYYQAPLGDKLSFIIAPVISENDLLDETNPLFSSSGTGALSRFNRRNPAVHRFEVDAGAGLTYEFSDNLNLQLAYGVPDAENPADEEGILFDGSYTALAQLNLSLLEDKLALSATYGRGYYSGDAVGDNDINLSGSTGSETAKRPFGSNATSANRFGIQGDFALTDAISVGGWVGYVDGEDEITGN